MGPEVGPAFQRRSRDTLKCILGVRLAETVSRHVVQKECVWFFLAFSVPVGGNELIGHDRHGSVTDSQGDPDDVRALGGGYVASQTLVEEQHHTIAGAMMWCGKIPSGSTVLDPGKLCHAA
eukprot:gene14389-biopygen6576